jgi:hypothetical protein
MRLELAGSILKPPPLTVKLLNGVDFVPQQYIDQGYTDFEVLVIGAGGGTGGGIRTGNTGTQIRSYGGAGGGGGLHRVRGVLSALPATCPVVVGVGGDPGLDHVSDPALATDGQDGGASSFNGNTARASGGQGGRKVTTNSVTVSSQANGGDGGVGDRILPGGGGAGGIAGTPTSTGPGTPGTAGADGDWDGVVGEGGGGGAGGIGTYLGVTANAATAGGRGSFDPGDTSVYGLGSSASSDTSDSGAANIVPGGAGGARATPLNHLPVDYGDSFGTRLKGQDGYIAIQLSVR